MVISRVLSAPSLTADTIFVGLVINGQQVAWGHCVQAVNRKQAEIYSSFTAEESQQTIQKVVGPALTGQALEDFQGLTARIDSLTETAVITHHPKPAKQSSSVSRRALLTGKLWDNAPDTEQMTVKRPLHPAIRYGVSQALLSALAQEQDVTLAEYIASEYNLPWPPRPIPIHLELDSEAPTLEASWLSPKIQSLGYRITGDNPQTQLGTNGERLQQFLRQLAELITRVGHSSYQPTIHLDAAGSLGQLFDNNAGRVLGALYGLEQAAKPYPLRVVDPVLLDAQEAQIELMRQLMEYVRMRRMTVQLAAGAGINSLADVEAFVQAEAVHLLTLSMPDLGSIHQVIEAIMICQKGKTATSTTHILLEGPAETAVHVALAAQPDLLAASAGPHGRRALSTVHDEMTRTLVWLAAKT